MKRNAPRFFFAIVLTSVLLIYVAASLRPSIVTGSRLPGAKVTFLDDFPARKYVRSIIVHKRGLPGSDAIKSDGGGTSHSSSSSVHVSPQDHMVGKQLVVGESGKRGGDQRDIVVGEDNLSSPKFLPSNKAVNQALGVERAGVKVVVQKPKIPEILGTSGGAESGGKESTRENLPQKDPSKPEENGKLRARSRIQAALNETSGHRSLHPALEPHNMTDAQLFARAISAGNNNSIGASKAKVAEWQNGRMEECQNGRWCQSQVLCLTNHPECAKRHEKRYSIYIHASPGYAYQAWELPECFLGRHIPSQSVHWGGPDLVDAERRLLANGLLDINNRRFILLSETCIPLHPFNYVYNYIFGSSYSFLTSVHDEDESKTWGPDMLPEIPKEMWRKGDQWKELHRVVALNVIQDTKYYNKFLSHFSCPTCDPYKVGFMDERYIPTFLHASKSRRLANRSITWVDWKNHDDWLHPHTFDRHEVTPQLLREMKTSTKFYAFNYASSEQDCYVNGKISPCFLFARKFRADSVAVLLKFSKVLLGF